MYLYVFVALTIQWDRLSFKSFIVSALRFSSIEVSPFSPFCQKCYPEPTWWCKQGGRLWGQLCSSNHVSLLCIFMKKMAESCLGLKGLLCTSKIKGPYQRSSLILCCPDRLWSKATARCQASHTSSNLLSLFGKRWGSSQCTHRYPGHLVIMKVWTPLENGHIWCEIGHYVNNLTFNGKSSKVEVSIREVFV